MPVYRYRAMTSAGMIVENTMEESSKYLAIKKLKRNDLVPINVEKSYRMIKAKNTERKNIVGRTEVLKSVDTANLFVDQERKKTTFFEKIYHTVTKSERITVNDIMVFTQNFYLLKKANFNNIHALNTIIESTENFTFRGILEDILAGVEAGDTMYSTMEYYEDVFPYIYINMIKVGELSGNLTNALDQALKYLEDTSALNRTLKGILIPNLVEFFAILVMLIVGTLVALPAIQNLYTSMGSSATLPPISLWFSKVVNWIIRFWYIPTFIIAGIVGFVLWYINTPKGKYNFHYFKYTMPVFGQLIFAIDFSRIMRAMLLNLNNGMRIQEALDVAKNISKNLVLRSILESSINNILIGESWIAPFERSGLATPMMTEMLRIGMDTDLAEMMEKLVEYMEIDIKNLLDKTVKVLPQIVYALVGVVLIFFVLVVLVPCIELYMGGWLLDAYGF